MLNITALCAVDRFNKDAGTPRSHAKLSTVRLRKIKVLPCRPMNPRGDMANVM